MPSASAPAVAVVALLLVGLAGCGGAPGRPGDAGSTAAPAAVVTEADSGRSVHLAVGQTAALRLSARYEWSEPRASGSTVRIDRTAAAGEWTVAAVHRGTSDITSAGRPACSPGSACPAVVLAFSVTVVVT